MFSKKELEMHERLFICEALNCDQMADHEFIMVDEDGEVFYTYRCRKHPETDPQFVRRDVYTWLLVDEGLINA